MKHAYYSPSSSYRWLNCPGSKSLPVVEQEKDENIASELGTLIHEIAADFICEYGVNDCEVSLDKISDKYKAHTLFEEKWEDIEHCLEYYLKTIKEEVNTYESYGSYDVEVLYKYSDLFFGTTDFVYETKEVLGIFDLKTGRHERVLVKENTQLLCYLFLFLHQKGKRFEDYKSIRLGVVAPFLEDFPCVWEPTLEEYKEFEVGLLKKIKKNDPVFHIGSWCKFCPSKGACSMVAEKIKDLTTIHGGNGNPAYLSNLSGEQISELLEVFENFKDFGDSLMKFAEHEAVVGGVKIPGFKVVERRRIKRWEPGAEKKLKEKFGSRAYESKLKTPSAMEKVANLDEKEFVRDNYYVKFRGYTITKESSRLKEVPEEKLLVLRRKSLPVECD